MRERAKKLEEKANKHADFVGLEISLAAALENTVRFRAWGDNSAQVSAAELINRTCSVSEFNLYAPHVATMHRQKNAARQLQLNLLPNMIEGNVDFSENAGLNVPRTEVQSAHWRSDSATLFICVLRYLCVDRWNGSCSSLGKGTIVSTLVQGSWESAEVLETYLGVPDADGMVSLRWLLRPRALQQTTKLLRSQVRERHLITVPVIAVSDDKQHDTAFVQHFLSHIIFGESGWFHLQGTSFVQAHDVWLWNSDGAASHFKQAGTLFFLHQLREQNKLLRTAWMFGAPGHGKGVWDGLGGTIKRAVRNHLLRNDATICTAQEYYELVVYLFAFPEKQKEYALRKNVQC